MFGLGMGEIVIVLVLALILLGPQKLPDAAKQLGKGLREFRRATEDLKNQFESELYSQEKPQRPTLVAGGEPKPPAPAEAAAGVPGTVPAPRATAANVPGLEAALVPAQPAAPTAPADAAAPAEAAAPAGNPDVQS